MNKLLIKIAKKLNNANITWALGGSLILKHHNLLENVNDIDIIIARSDIFKAKHIFDSLGEAKRVSPKGIYKTSYFYEYTIDSIEVDVMCEFKIDNQSLYNYNFDVTKIVDTEILTGTKIYYSSLEDWLVLYTLMGRTKKVELIKRYFETNLKINQNLITNALASAPKKIKQDIESWLSNMKGDVLSNE
ncbi:hypothetical protein RJI07_00985 [Mycoplasmatota bacterium WC30]